MEIGNISELFSKLFVLCVFPSSLVELWHYNYLKVLTRVVSLTNGPVWEWKSLLCSRLSPLAAAAATHLVIHKNKTRQDKPNRQSDCCFLSQLMDHKRQPGSDLTLVHFASLLIHQGSHGKWGGPALSSIIQHQTFCSTWSKYSVFHWDIRSLVSFI